MRIYFIMFQYDYWFYLQENKDKGKQHNILVGKCLKCLLLRRGISIFIALFLIIIPSYT